MRPRAGKEGAGAASAPAPAALAYDMRHRWLFYSGMARGEALVVGGYDERYEAPHEAPRRVHRAALELAGYFALQPSDVGDEGGGAAAAGVEARPTSVEVGVVALVPL